MEGDKEEEGKSHVAEEGYLGGSRERYRQARKLEDALKSRERGPLGRRDVSSSCRERGRREPARENSSQLQKGWGRDRSMVRIDRRD